MVFNLIYMLIQYMSLVHTWPLNSRNIDSIVYFFIWVSYKHLQLFMLEIKVYITSITNTLNLFFIQSCSFWEMASPHIQSWIPETLPATRFLIIHHVLCVLCEWCTWYIQVGPAVLVVYTASILIGWWLDHTSW